MSLLTSDEILHSLAGLTDWHVEEKEIVKTYLFSSYLTGIDFVQRLAVEADRVNHHPALLVLWRSVTVRLSTHSAGGLTEKDFALARVADACALVC